MLKSLAWERISPFVVALAAAGLWASMFRSSFPNEVDALLAASITVASVLGGFLGTAKAIVLTVKDSAVFRTLKDSGYLSDFLVYLKDGITLSLCMASICLVGFFIDLTNPVWKTIVVKDVFGTIWVFVTVAAILTYFRVYRILFKLLQHV